MARAKPRRGATVEKLLGPAAWLDAFSFSADHRERLEKAGIDRAASEEVEELVRSYLFVRGSRSAEASEAEIKAALAEFENPSLSSEGVIDLQSSTITQTPEGIREALGHSRTLE